MVPFGKELSFCHELEFQNPNIFETCQCKPLIFQTQTILTRRINSLKYQRSTNSGCKDIGIRKSEFLAKTQFLCMIKIKEISSCIKINYFQLWLLYNSDCIKVLNFLRQKNNNSYSESQIEIEGIRYFLMHGHWSLEVTCNVYFLHLTLFHPMSYI